MTDEDRAERRFLERLQRRDERAFNELVQIYQARVFRLMLRMLGRREEAEDMAQEVFVHIFKAIGDFRGEAKLSTWIYKIAANLCKNRMKYLARRKRGREEELRSESESLSDADFTQNPVTRPDQVVEGYQIERILQECIQELEPDFREVLILRDVEDLSYEDVSEVTGLPDGTVKSRLHRARTLLKTRVTHRLGEARLPSKKST